MILSTQEMTAKFQKMCYLKRAAEADMEQHRKDTPEGAELLRQFHQELADLGSIGGAPLQREFFNYMEREGGGAYWNYPDSSTD